MVLALKLPNLYTSGSASLLIKPDFTTKAAGLQLASGVETTNSTITAKRQNQITGTLPAG